MQSLLQSILQLSQFSMLIVTAPKRQRLSQQPCGSMCVMLGLRQQLAWLLTQPWTFNLQTGQIYPLHLWSMFVMGNWMQKNGGVPC